MPPRSWIDCSPSSTWPRWASLPCLPRASWRRHASVPGAGSGRYLSCSPRSWSPPRWTGGDDPGAAHARPAAAPPELPLLPVLRCSRRHCCCGAVPRRGPAPVAAHQCCGASARDNACLHRTRWPGGRHHGRQLHVPARQAAEPNPARCPGSVAVVHSIGRNNRADAAGRARCSFSCPQAHTTVESAACVITVCALNSRCSGLVCGGVEMRRLLIALATLFSVALSLFPTAAAAAYAPGTYTGTLADGAIYKIEVPIGWNGTLVLYSHGYSTSPTGATDIGDAATGAWLLSHGYALAGSSYATTGWALQQAFPDQMAVLDVFQPTVGEAPTRTIAWGHSLGGMITAGLVQLHPDRFDGAIPMCGVVAGGVGAW